MKQRLLDLLGTMFRILPDAVRQWLMPFATRIKDRLHGAALRPTEQRDVRRDLCACARAAMNEQRYEDAISIVAAADDLTGEENLRSRDLCDARLLRVDALALLGRGLEALEALDRLDAYYGASFGTSIRRARLGLFTGRYDEAIAAAEQAMLSLPLQKGESPELREAALAKVGLLTQKGEFACAREFFLRIFPTSDLKRPLTDRQVACLRKTIVDTQSLVLFKDLMAADFAFHGRRAINSLFHYSIAARDLGQYDEALLAIQRRFIVGSKLVPFGGKQASARVDWSDSARRTLLDLRQDLSAAGIDFFLISGTLLGCIREGNILGHDKDIDVGVMDHVGPADIRKALIGTGRFMPLPLVTERILRVKHACGVMLDIFFHWEHDGRLLHEGQKTRWWNTPFSLVEHDFLGEKFLVPDNADLYLSENYGDWRTPVQAFETFCDTPNMLVADEKELLWYYYRALLDHFYAGGASQFVRVWERIKQLSAPGIETRMAVESAQRRIRNKLGMENALQ